jgi:hypothetical protein
MVFLAFNLRFSFTGNILNWNQKGAHLRVDQGLLLRFGSAIAKTCSNRLDCSYGRRPVLPPKVGSLPAGRECGGVIMRIHQNQVNPNAQLDAMYAAQKAAAKREAERARKKLVEFASELAGEADAEACVVKLGAREEAEAGTKQNIQQWSRKRKKARDPEDAESSISDWA